MASKWLSSPLARLAFLTGGTVLLTLGISRDENEWLWIYNPQIEMFARFKMKSSFHKTKRII